MMTKYLKNKFQLTETGAKGLLKSSITAFLYYFSFLPPLLIVLTFANLIVSGNNGQILNSLIALVIAAIIMLILTNVDYKVKFNETYKESANLRIDIANHLRELPLSYFSKHDVSDLAQTIMSDISVIEHALAHAIGGCIGFSVYFIIMSIMMLIGNFKLALSIIIPLVLSVIVIFATKKIQIIQRKKHYLKLRKISENFQNAIEMNQEIRSYGLKDKVQINVQKDLNEAESIQWKTENISALPLSLASYIAQLSIGFTIYFGINYYVSKEINLVMLIAYIIAAAKMSGGISALYEYIEEIFYIDIRIKRIKEIRNTKTQQGKIVELKNFDVNLKDVEFSYNESAKVIKGVSFIAKQNEVTALVGPSGCGKTTILRLISRLYDYNHGSITIDGHDIREIDTNCLFKYISVVFQDVTLFDTTIMDNIRIGNLDASDDEVKRVAKASGCYEFIEKLPNKFQTRIGENGARLSGGERQRISIARALLKDAPIVILDEIASSLDVINEVKIQEALNKLTKDKTVIIISHRLKSIENANKIVVMKDGFVESIGTHKELLNNSLTYRKMIDNSINTENYVY